MRQRSIRIRPFRSVPFHRHSGSCRELRKSGRQFYPDITILRERVDDRGAVVRKRTIEISPRDVSPIYKIEEIACY